VQPKESRPAKEPALSCYDETCVPRSDYCMVRKEEMIKGRYLRTLSDAWSVPAGTLARVETVGRTWQGEFVFTVRWLNGRIGTQSRPVSDRSLNLWEQDLARFEAASKEEAAAVKAAALTLEHSKLKPSVGDTRRFSKIKMTNFDQLSLFTLEDL
jgi:hypothetical protein